jgi:SAM-dependent methyltransferase
LASEWSLHNPQTLWRAHSDRVNLALLNRWLPAAPVEAILKTDLFDEAFGDGLAPLLAARARCVYGIDLSERVIAAVRARYPSLASVRADVRALPFPDAVFDAVVSISTLDHFEDHAEIDVSLEEIARTLKPGGRLLLTLDNRANPAVALRNALPFRMLNAMGLVPYFVGATYGPRTLPRAVARAGLTVLNATATLHCPRVLAVPLTSLVQARGGPGVRQWFSRLLVGFERLSGLPTRYLTGHFVAVEAIKR